MSTPGQIVPPIHPEGRRFILLFAVITLGFFWLAEPLGWVGVVLTLWCAYFFRDPARVTPVAEGLVIAPADGLVLPIVEVVPPKELGFGDKPMTRVSIFMNVFNVHVNRIPADGKITRLAYVPGKFLNADMDKASEDNERQVIAMETSSGMRLGFVQIAGLVARRIVCYLDEDQGVVAGERFGLIRFGSRVDVYLDEGISPQVIEGQKTIAGETVLADNRFGEGVRSGNVD